MVVLVMDGQKVGLGGLLGAAALRQQAISSQSDETAAANGPVV